MAKMYVRKSLDLYEKAKIWEIYADFAKPISEVLLISLVAKIPSLECIDQLRIVWLLGISVSITGGLMTTKSHTDWLIWQNSEKYG